MSESKHTPGPWRVEGEDWEDGFQIIGRPSWGCKRHGVEGEWDVAEVDDLCGDYPGEMLANARLIAAAPDLLDACKRAKEFIRNGVELGFIRMPDAGTPDPAHETPGAIAAAIAKAEGRS